MLELLEVHILKFVNNKIKEGFMKPSFYILSNIEDNSFDLAVK